MKNFISVCWNWFHGYHQNLSKLSIFLSSVFKTVKPAWILIFCVAWICILQNSGLSDVCVCSLTQLLWHCTEMKVLCTWKYIQVISLLQKAVMGVRQTSEIELLPEHLPMWVFKQLMWAISIIVSHVAWTYCWYLSKRYVKKIIVFASPFEWNSNVEQENWWNHGCYSDSKSLENV